MNTLFNPEDYVIFERGRVFIDICEEGCGSGCLYCYVPSKNLRQDLLGLERIRSICNYVITRYSTQIRIISLCPNTEPLKSEESIKSIRYIIEFFSRYSYPIQISTKEIIPFDFLQFINNLKTKIYINISIPVWENAYKVEPHAASLNDRLHNFKYINEFENIVFSLYIKPYLGQNIDAYISAINKYKVKSVCIGPLLISNDKYTCISLYCDPTAVLRNQTVAINNSMKKIKECTSAEVYISSICMIYNVNQWRCPYRFPHEDYPCCLDCNCKGE